MWCVPTLTPEFIERMENILTLYAKPYHFKEPVICFDEKSKQLIADARMTQPMKSGKPRRRDYEYKRNGTRNIFLAVEPKGGFRIARVTAHRMKIDFAHEIERIVTLPRYQDAARIHIVLDNLNTHFEKSLLEAFGTRKTRSLMRRIRFHYTPKHASWLNMAEIELSILARQCLNRRIPTEALLVREVAGWEKYRNDRRSTIQWAFTVKDAARVFREYYRTALVE